MPTARTTPLLLAGACLLWACDSVPASESPSEPQPVAEPPAPEPAGPTDRTSLVLITMDTTRADHMGAYGYEKARTPAFDRIAQQGVLFDRAYSAIPLTTPSHATMLTGLYPPRHGIRNNGDAILADGATTLAEVLKDEGYRTAASVGAFVTTAVWNLDQGFDDYYDEVKAPGAQASRWANERAAGAVVNDVIEWLKDPARSGDGSQPIFLWVHFYDPHHPYAPPPAFAQHFENPYDGEIAFMDSQIARLRAAVEAHPAGARTAWVAVADHGEAVEPEHGEITHGMFLYEQTQHVPFAFTPAQPLATPVVVRDLAVSGADVMPTALGLVGLAPPEGLDGRDLSGFASGQVPSREPIYMETLGAQQRFGYHPELAAVEGPTKMIATPSARLFDVVADPGETQNLLAERPEDAQRLREAAESHFRAKPDFGDSGVLPAPEVVEQLAALGYVSTDVQASAELSQVDVKDKVDTIAQLEAARAFAQSTDDQEAIIRRYSELLKKYPEFSEIRLGLGTALLRVRRPDEAEAVFRQALEAAPRSTVMRLNLGNAIAAQRRPDEALALYESILVDVPGDASAQTAILHLLLEQGRVEEVVERGRVWLAEDPGDHSVQALVGMALTQLDQNQEAEQLLTASLVDRVQRSRVHWCLAVIASKSDRNDVALAHLQIESAQYPGDLKARQDLGELLLQLERWEEAASEYEFLTQAVPDNVEFRRIWAQATFNTSQFEAAGEILKPALEQAPYDPDVLVLQANVLSKLGRRDEAVAIFEQAKELKALEIAERKGKAPPAQ